MAVGFAATVHAWLDRCFDDKRVTISYIMVWFACCVVGFTWLGIFKSEYMAIGPSPTLLYMGMLIDTYPRYFFVAFFVAISTAINDFASDSLGPWIQNTCMDHKSRTIPYSKWTIIFITQLWSFYCGIMGVASIALVFAQFDLICIRLVVDLAVNQYTMRRFLRNKTHDSARYHKEFFDEDEDGGDGGGDGGGGGASASDVELAAAVAAVSMSEQGATGGAARGAGNSSNKTVVKLSLTEV